MFQTVSSSLSFIYCLEKTTGTNLGNNLRCAWPVTQLVHKQPQLTPYSVLRTCDHAQKVAPFCLGREWVVGKGARSSAKLRRESRARDSRDHGKFILQQAARAGLLEALEKQSGLLRPCVLPREI